MTRYVFADLDQVSTELTRRASEVTAWLDAVASGGGPPDSTAAGHGAAGYPPVSGVPADPVARLVAELDLACYQAMSAASGRLVAAAESITACAAALREVDVVVARRLCAWSGR
ncbi:MAG TPA: hypothetical protein VGM75_02095 [Pseudonocardiaceae bacterium]|jgi:hypothetical protein